MEFFKVKKPLLKELYNTYSRTKWTRRVPHPVLIGHAASLTPYAMQGKPAPADGCGVVVGPFGGSLGRLWSGLVAPALSGEDAARG